MPEVVDGFYRGSQLTIRRINGGGWIVEQDDMLIKTCAAAHEAWELIRSLVSQQRNFRSVS